MFGITADMAGKVIPLYIWGTAIVAALGCACGFYEFVWFMSVGYGFAVCAIGAFFLISGLICGVMTPAVAVMCVLMMVYGWRLGYYLVKREFSNKEYKKTLDSTGATKKMPMFLNIAVWLYCVFEYVLQVSCVMYRMTNHASDNLFAWIGALIMLAGILGEALADKQKSAAKAVNPKRFCDVGLFKVCRCPNYFSEILFWIGVFVTGIGTVSGKQWILPVIGLILIVIVMVNSAQRLEKRHEKNYGSDPEYQKYSDTTPILFPLLPIYHLNKIERK